MMFKRHFSFKDCNNTPAPSFLRKLISSVVLYAYVLSFVVSPVYASTEVMEPLPSRLHNYHHEKLPQQQQENLLQRQFRLWNNLPSLNQKALPFEQQYQPAGWANHCQVSLGFENTRTMGIFNIPAGKDFVNLAGADWLQNIYAAEGWHCFLEDDESALAFSYRPGGREETIAFSLDYLGNVRLSALNTKKAILYTSGVLSLAFDDDTVTPPHLIVAAPVVLNETSLVTEQLQIFTQKHENHGGYEVEKGDIKAKHTINRSYIKAIEKFILGRISQILREKALLNSTWTGFWIITNIQFLRVISSPFLQIALIMNKAPLQESRSFWTLRIR
jgi:hypothetical protein